VCGGSRAWSAQPGGPLCSRPAGRRIRTGGIATSTLRLDAMYSVDRIFCRPYNLTVAWGVEFTDEFGTWWDSLTADEQESVDFGVGLLIERGPTLPFPYSSQVKGSQFGEMRELRVQHQGNPYRVLYAFDPRRVALLLLGGDKTGDQGWYERMVPVADRLFAEHLADLKKKQQQ
jgi:hypothetical protein